MGRQPRSHGPTRTIEQFVLMNVGALSILDWGFATTLLSAILTNGSIKIQRLSLSFVKKQIYSYIKTLLLSILVVLVRFDNLLGFLQF